MATSITYKSGKWGFSLFPAKAVGGAHRSRAKFPAPGV